MYIEVDKQFTRPFKVKEVKKAIVLFKRKFTENDLRNIYADYFNKIDCFNGEVANCRIIAGEQNYYSNKIFFSIRFYIIDIDNVKRIMYAILYNPDDESYSVHPDITDYKIFKEEGSKNMEKYYINYGTGAGNEWTNSIEEAMKIAKENCAYTQCNIKIQDENHKDLYKSLWIGIKYDPNEDQDEPIAIFGNFGYYTAWTEC